MKKKVLYSWILILTLLVMLAGCGENAHRNSSSGQPGSTLATTGVKPVAESNRMDALSDTVSKTSPIEDSAFMHTWKLFVQTVKKHDTQKLKKLIVFPLMGAGACYIPHDRLQDPEQDTTGITGSQFDSLYQEIFDQHAVQQIIAPLSENDPILVWQGTGLVDSLITQNRDPGTQIYGYHIEYVKGIREGGKYFVFARFVGRYKLAALLCDGIL